ncbi:H-NS histone family protein [Alphaproteobacteria bacterium KMM 3653]|uniref:H-NS histone family protein n=1 Tax=Harenicola maris TaxID=2841044 RepID=A0AAP2G4N1_9RHOB|nr:H-NS histone family protein [Harenicola maris]
MKVSLKGMTRKELEKLQEQIVVQLDKLAAKDLEAAKAAAEKAAAAYGVSLDDLVGGKTGRKKRAKAAGPIGKAKYKNPANPDQTWTGRGRRPQWVIDALGAGKNLEDMAI